MTNPNVLLAGVIGKGKTTLGMALATRSLADAREAVRKQWGAGLLLDIHGQGSEIDTIFRGTAGGQSVKHLLDRHGEE